MADILIIDDQATEHTQQLIQWLGEMGHHPVVAGGTQAGLELALEPGFEIILLGIADSKDRSLESIAGLHQLPHRPQVIVMTAAGDTQGAEIALVSGAWDYLHKPLNFAPLQLNLRRALDYRQAKLADQSELDREFIIGNHPRLLACLATAAQSAATDGAVLITGESGTGKELFAQLVHENSSRREKALVTVDCTNLTATLAASLLFGYRRGAFTGADRNTDGLIIQAHGGTLFLDEVGDLPIETQRSLLRVLQTHRFRSLGANTEIDCNFRVVAATNRDLKTDIAAGRFREDLYYRLSAFQIRLPALRERGADVQLLAHHYITELCRGLGIDAKHMSQEFADTLQLYDWPGNVRELINVLQAALVQSLGETVLYPQALPLELRLRQLQYSFGSKDNEARAAEAVLRTPVAPASDGLPTYQEFRSHLEKTYLQQLMLAAQGRVSKACEISKLSRARIYQMLAKHDLRPRKSTF
jgi:two-component system NtrC family response regulator